jgi:hypothetical protein
MYVPVVKCNQILVVRHSPNGHERKSVYCRFKKDKIALENFGQFSIISLHPITIKTLTFLDLHNKATYVRT